MATIFLSYRRTDSPQASRVYDWLGQRLGYDAIFMDVAAIPFGVRFPDFIREAIAKSRVLIALIGDQWATRTRDENDPVRMEIETAIENQIPVLPVLIGNTPMPNVAALPESISAIATQNADTVGVLLDFHSHMQLLLPKIESILGTLATTSVGRSDPHLIRLACRGVVDFVRARAAQGQAIPVEVEFKVIGVDDFMNPPLEAITLYLHRVGRLAELIELHFILSFWARDPGMEQWMAGWLISQLEQSPVVPDEYLRLVDLTNEFSLKVRWSDEDPRQVWKMITDAPLRLSLAYVATVSPRGSGDVIPTVVATEPAE